MNGGMAFFSAEQRSIEVYVPVSFFSISGRSPLKEGERVLVLGLGQKQKKKHIESLR